MKRKSDLIEYWQKSSQMDFEASLDLFKSKKYPHSLFFAHLSVEKLLKALYVNIEESYPPITHNLLMLSKKLNLEFNDSQMDALSEINTFNIEARYPDEKFDFYKKCTFEFTEKYLK